MSLTKRAIDTSKPRREDLLRMEALLKIRQYRLDFLVNHHVNTNGQKMNPGLAPHIIDMYNTISPEIVLMGSTQSLKSEFLIIDTLAMAKAGLSVFFVLPKVEMRNSYVQNRIDRCVQNVPEYKKMMGNGFFDNVLLKGFGDGVIKFVGSNVFADFREFPAGAYNVEEYDQCDEHNLKLGVDRLQASIFQFKRFVSNPSFVNKGIHAKFLESNQQERYVPCTVCGNMVKLDWFDTVVKVDTDAEGSILNCTVRDKEWDKNSSSIRRPLHCMCPFCYDKGIQSPINRLDDKGIWKAENPESLIEGKHISALCSPFASITDMYKEFTKSLYNPSDLQIFYNSRLGLPYEPIGCKITDNLLRSASAKHPQEFILTDHYGYADLPGKNRTMGIDVNGFLDFRISDFTETRRERTAVAIGKARSFNELFDMIRKFRVTTVVIDIGPDIHKAIEFQEECYSKDIDCFRCKFSNDEKLRGYKINSEQGIVFIQKTVLIDSLFDALKTGRNIIPQNYENIFDGKWAKEMQSSVKVLDKETHDKEKFYWKKADDDSMLADAYDLLASKLQEGNTISESFII